MALVGVSDSAQAPTGAAGVAITIVAIIALVGRSMAGLHRRMRRTPSAEMTRDSVSVDALTERMATMAGRTDNISATVTYMQKRQCDMEAEYMQQLRSLAATLDEIDARLAEMLGEDMGREVVDFRRPRRR